MPYRKINHFFRPFGIDEYGHFNIYVGENIIKITPFDETVKSINYLCRAMVVPLGIYIPEDIRKIAGIGKTAYVEEIGDDTYLMNKHFDSDPTKVTFDRCPEFTRIAAPGPDFYEEAAKSTPVQLSDNYGGLTIPMKLRKAIPDKLAGPCVTVSVFSEDGAHWVEVRADNPSVPLNTERVYANAVYDPISGITYRVGRNKCGIGTRYIQTGDILHAPLFGWYSETRKAVIIEMKPEYCAVCGTPMRWSQPGHAHKIVASNNVKYLGRGRAIHTLVKAEKAIKNAQMEIDRKKYKV